MNSITKLDMSINYIIVKSCGKCPECGSTDVIPWGHNTCQCRDCGAEW